MRVGDAVDLRLCDHHLTTVEAPYFAIHSAAVMGFQPMIIMESTSSSG
jgi:hypothetical protein